MICCNIVDLAVYLDNFIFWSADHTTCQLAVHTAMRLALLVKPAKVEGPIPSSVLKLTPYLESYASRKQNWHV